MKKRINITIDDSLLEIIDRESNRNYISRSAFISFAICMYFKAMELLEVEKEYFANK